MSTYSFGQAPPGIMNRAAAPLPPGAPPPTISLPADPRKPAPSSSLPPLPGYDRDSIYLGRTPVRGAGRVTVKTSIHHAEKSPVTVRDTPVPPAAMVTRPPAFFPASNTSIALPSSASLPGWTKRSNLGEERPPIERGVTLEQLEEHYSLDELQQHARDAGMVGLGTFRAVANRVLSYLEGGVQTAHQQRKAAVTIDIVQEKSSPSAGDPITCKTSVARPVAFAVVGPPRLNTPLISKAREGISLEVSVEGLASVREAASAAVDRIELCANLTEGGTTPSGGLVKCARRIIDELKSPTKLFVLIRPRPGNFLYSEPEIVAMVFDIKMCKELKADGVVIGALTTSDGSQWKVDTDSLSTLVEAAHPLSVTFHRAFDLLPEANINCAVETIADLGISRILTSGLKNTAMEGVETIANIVKLSAGRIDIMAAAGIGEGNVAKILDRTGVQSIHVGSAARSASVESLPRPRAVLFKDPHVTDKDKIVALLKAANIKRETADQPPPITLGDVNTKCGGMAAPAPISFLTRDDFHDETSSPLPNVERHVSLSEDRMEELEKMERMMSGSLTHSLRNLKSDKEEVAKGIRKGEKAVRCKHCGGKFPKRLIVEHPRCPGCGFASERAVGRRNIAKKIPAFDFPTSTVSGPSTCSVSKPLVPARQDLPSTAEGPLTEDVFAPDAKPTSPSAPREADASPASTPSSIATSVEESLAARLAKALEPCRDAEKEKMVNAVGMHVAPNAAHASARGPLIAKAVAEFSPAKAGGCLPSTPKSLPAAPGKVSSRGPKELPYAHSKGMPIPGTKGPTSVSGGEPPTSALRGSRRGRGGSHGVTKPRRGGKRERGKTGSVRGRAAARDANTSTPPNALPSPAKALPSPAKFLPTALADNGDPASSSTADLTQPERLRSSGGQNKSLPTLPISPDGSEDLLAPPGASRGLPPLPGRLPLLDMGNSLSSPPQKVPPPAPKPPPVPTAGKPSVPARRSSSVPTLGKPLRGRPRRKDGRGRSIARKRGRGATEINSLPRNDSREGSVGRIARKDTV